MLLDILMTIRIFSASNHLLDQQQALCNPGAPRHTIFFVPALHDKSHAVMMICIRSHLRRILLLLADRGDLLLAMPPARSTWTTHHLISLDSVQVEVLGVTTRSKPYECCVGV